MLKSTFHLFLKNWKIWQRGAYIFTEQLQLGSSRHCGRTAAGAESQIPSLVRLCALPLSPHYSLSSLTLFRVFKACMISWGNRLP